MKHTEGRLRVGGTFNPDSGEPTVNVWSEAAPGMQSGNVIAHRCTPANAHRLVACWNALLNVDTEFLERVPQSPGFTILQLLTSERKTLETQIDELARALRYLMAEVGAMLSLAEPAMREAAGHSNTQCLLNRLRESGCVLDKYRVPA